jgi:DNA-binding response OmpR family regulator
MADATSARAVLVVEDDRDLRDLVADVLEDSGRRVFTASDGADALRQIEEDGIPRPCIVLLDWFMAPMGGRAFLEHLSLRRDASGFGVILLSASSAATPGDLPWRVLGVLRKPFGIDELVAALDRME